MIYISRDPLAAPEHKKQIFNVLCTSLLWAWAWRVSASFLGRHGGCRVRFQLNGRACRPSRAPDCPPSKFSPEEPAGFSAGLAPECVF